MPVIDKTLQSRLDAKDNDERKLARKAGRSHQIAVRPAIGRKRRASPIAQLEFEVKPKKWIRGKTNPLL
eukprot:10590245-Karenia_brevis.AAC.1